VQHIAEDNTWISNDGRVSYQNRFEAFKAALAWRNLWPRRTRAWTASTRRS